MGTANSEIVQKKLPESFRMLRKSLSLHFYSKTIQENQVETEHFTHFLSRSESSERLSSWIGAYLQRGPHPEGVARVHRLVGPPVEAALLPHDAPAADPVQLSPAQRLLQPAHQAQRGDGAVRPTACEETHTTPCERILPLEEQLNPFRRAGEAMLRSSILHLVTTYLAIL